MRSSNAVRVGGEICRGGGGGGGGGADAVAAPPPSRARGGGGGTTSFAPATALCEGAGAFPALAGGNRMLPESTRLESLERLGAL